MRIACNETELQRLAQGLSCVVTRGDAIALHGDLGAGKTTFSRYLIWAILGRAEEIPSPTFSLVQTYAAPRFEIAHFDLYRLSDASEAVELGFQEAVDDGLVLVEWPERAEELLPASRLELHFHETDDPEIREIRLQGLGAWQDRLDRFERRQGFLAAAGYGGYVQSFLQGDASARSYARLRSAAYAGEPVPPAASIILMDAPEMPDGPPLRDGLPYSQIAHLAEDVSAFVAVGGALREAGFAAPKICAHDLDNGFLLLEDLGDRVVGAVLEGAQASGDEEGAAAQEMLWRAATDALLALRTHKPAAELPLPLGARHALPRYDQRALQIEIELLADWLWPALYDAPITDGLREEFLALWAPVLDRLQEDADHWVLRDYHSPNLIWLPERPAPQNVGIIDFQDAMRGPAAYDLVSLLQDARLDVPAALEGELLDHYCTKAAAKTTFDRSAFAFAYRATGTQRASKILGIFARLAKRDGKPQYLKHMPRIWRYLARNLEHPELGGLKAWYDRYFPQELRERDIAP